MTGFESDFDDIDDTPTIDDLWHGMVELTARIDDLATRVLTPTTGLSRGEPTYPTVKQWVERWWAVHLERDVTGSRHHWCAQWTQHPEAVSRLTALWQRWEELQAEWGGMALWWRDLDAQTHQLLGPDGPFRHCRTGDTQRHRPPTPIPAKQVSDADQDPDTTESPQPQPD